MECSPFSELGMVALSYDDCSVHCYVRTCGKYQNSTIIKTATRYYVVFLLALSTATTMTMQSNEAFYVSLINSWRPAETADVACRR